jgi:DNA helicase-2/ATP-dependent DNA helicase PcrA
VTPDKAPASRGLGKEEDWAGPQVDYLSSLNDCQREAVTAPAGATVIVASAGSGKTLTLTARIAHFLAQGVPAHAVLAITFTRKATEEMRQRVQRIIGWKRSAGMTVCNFHQLALRILRQHYALLGFSRQFFVASGEEQRELIRECVEAWAAMQGSAAKDKAAAPRLDPAQAKLLSGAAGGEGVDEHAEEALAPHERGALPGGFARRGAPKPASGVNGKLVSYFVSFVRKAKSRGIFPSAFTGDHRFVYQRYIELLTERCGIDFADMVPLTLHLFKRRPDILQQSQERYRYIFCDEYQDVTKDQFELLVQLAGPAKNLTVCGDDDQSIYGWRGVAVESFVLFDQTFPERRQIMLEQTYRSSAKIVRAVSSLISHNNFRKPKRLWTSNGDGENIRLLISDNASAEAKRIVNEVQRCNIQLGLRFGEIAVLARTRRVLQPIENALKAAGVPLINSAVAKRGLTKSREAQDLLAYCELVAGPGSAAAMDEAFERVVNVPKRGIGASTVDKLRTLTGADGSRAATLLDACRRAAHGEIGDFTAKTRGALSAFVVLIETARLRAREGAGAEAVLRYVIEESRYREHVAEACSTADEQTLRTVSWGIPSRSSRLSLAPQANIDGLLKRAQLFDGAAPAGSQRGQDDDDAERGQIALRTFVSNMHRAEESAEGAQGQRDFVTLSTIHQAKGLEWPAVFVVHFNEGVLPLQQRGDAGGEADDTPAQQQEQQQSQSQSTQAAGSRRAPAAGEEQKIDAEAIAQVRSSLNPLEEERRLGYVALSRARVYLFLSFVVSDMTGNPLMPSRFLHELPQDLIDSSTERRVNATAATSAVQLRSPLRDPPTASRGAHAAASRPEAGRGHATSASHRAAAAEEEAPEESAEGAQSKYFSTPGALPTPPPAPRTPPSPATPAQRPAQRISLSGFLSPFFSKPTLHAAGGSAAPKTEASPPKTPQAAVKRASPSAGIEAHHAKRSAPAPASAQSQPPPLRAAKRPLELDDEDDGELAASRVFGLAGLHGGAAPARRRRLKSLGELRGDESPDE